MSGSGNVRVWVTTESEFIGTFGIEEKEENAGAGG